MERIVITGVGSGIGLALAQHYLDAGHEVRAISRHCPPELQQRERFRFVSHDLGDLDGIAAAVRRAIDGLASVDRAVLNAGILAEFRDLRDTELSVIEHSMRINTWANKQLIDALAASGTPVRQIVGISSGAAVNGNRGWGAYSLSKATFVMLLKLYAAELPDTHFCSLAPGLVDTGMQAYLGGLSEEVAARFPSLQRIRAARGTERMPQPAQLAPRLAAAIEQARESPSGSYLDVRNM